MQKDIYKRLARAEAMANAQRAELEEVLRAAYARACDAQNETEAAVLARRLRDKLLDRSDKEMSLDRLGLDIPTGSTFSAWLSFLKGLGGMLSGGWAAYRQALRDLPEQPGFPYDIDWPEPPKESI